MIKFSNLYFFPRILLHFHDYRIWWEYFITTYKIIVLKTKKTKNVNNNNNNNNSVPSFVALSNSRRPIVWPRVRNRSCIRIAFRVVFTRTDVCIIWADACFLIEFENDLSFSKRFQTKIGVCITFTFWLYANVFVGTFRWHICNFIHFLTINILFSSLAVVQFKVNFPLVTHDII
jgi:hypothetical protein